MLFPSNDHRALETNPMSQTHDGSAPMQMSLRLVSERFQQVEKRARRLFDLSVDFRDLCDEYEACTETLAHLQTGGRESAGLRNEYAALLLRLERELLRCMEEHPECEES
jgi:hypothetical protein